MAIDNSNSNNNNEKKDDEKPIHLRLFDFDEDEIQNLNNYQLLGLEEPVRATPYTIKQAYRKASIRYHPDKTGHDDNDYVFIAIKAAWDTLSDVAKRQAYDSTEMPFDDSIPPDVAAAASLSSSTTSANSTISVNGLLYNDTDFYETFGPVFERNLRFDTRLQAHTSKRGAAEIPTLGDEEAPIEQVQAFYDYWVQFDSWRDFSQKAQEELFDNNNPLEDAESRYEKRFYQKEIDKRARALKRQEISRIQTLVQRAMAADPRLQQHYRQQKEAKEQATLERQLKKEQEEADRKLQQEKQQKEDAERFEIEKEERAHSKVQREKEKKLLRKAKQQLRKVTVANFQEQIDNNNNNKAKATDLPFACLESMSDEVEFVCGELSLLQIQELTEVFTKSKDFSLIHTIAQEHRGVKDEEKATKTKEAAERQKKREQEDRLKAEALALQKAWSQPELAALAKAVKKFPGGGGNRWEQIASYINSNCRPDEPRVREECIEKYNQIQKATMAAAAKEAAKAPAPEAAPECAPAKEPTPATAPQTNGFAKHNNRTTSTPNPATDKSSNGVSNGSSNGAANGSSNPKTMATSESTMTEMSTASSSAPDGWSDDQDKRLQDALAQFPGTMDKNERWTSIAKMVDGKSKKQCVQRFKVIRDAIKNKK